MNKAKIDEDLKPLKKLIEAAQKSYLIDLMILDALVACVGKRMCPVCKGRHNPLKSNDDGDYGLMWIDCTYCSGFGWKERIY